MPLPRSLTRLLPIFVLAACGSSTTGGSGGADAGTEGSSGAAGTGATAGSGGDGGASAGAGTSAGGDGGASASAGTSSGGDGGTAGSSGTAGAAGTTAGAAGASGGAAGSSGGAAGSSGGAAGAAGDGGSTTPRCDALCADVVAANCTNGPALSSCLLTCRALTSSSACNTQANTYFDCVDGTTVTCSGAGEPVAQGCGIAYLAAIGCAVQQDPNPAIVAPCDTYCDAVVAAACPNNGGKATCNTNCLWSGATGTGCGDEWETFLTCANNATLTCVLGYAVAPGCGSAFNTYRQCINAAGT